MSTRHKIGVNPTIVRSSLFLRWLCVSLACFFSTSTSFSLGSTFTVQDIIDGISARRSKVRDVEFQYLITNENYDAFYSEMARMQKTLKETAGENGETELLRPDRISTKAYHLFAKENKRAFKIFDVNDDTHVLNVRAVYDGENLQLLNTLEKNGMVKRIPPKDVIPFPTLPKLLSLENQDIAVYLQQPMIDVSIKDERIENGDFIVEVLLRRTYTPIPERPVEVITEHQVDINVQKDFWPIKIAKYVEIVNVTTGKNARMLQKVITAIDFVETGGIYYPTRIDEKVFSSDFTYLKDSLIPHLSGDSELLSKRTTIVEKVTANTELSDDIFEFEFPDGTTFYDENMGMGMIVGEVVENLAEYMIETAEALPVDEYTQEEAMAILAERRKGNWEEAQELRTEIAQAKKGKELLSGEIERKPESQTLNRIRVPIMVEETTKKPMMYIFWMALILFCVCSGYLVTRILKQKKDISHE